MYFVGYLPGCVYNVLFAGQLCDLCREGKKKVELTAVNFRLVMKMKKWRQFHQLLRLLSFSEKRDSTITHFKIYIVIMSLSEN